jgi:hypothetical protein
MMMTAAGSGVAAAGPAAEVCHIAPPGRMVKLAGGEPAPLPNWDDRGLPFCACGWIDGDSGGNVHTDTRPGLHPEMEAGALVTGRTIRA